MHTTDAEVTNALTAQSKQIHDMVYGSREWEQLRDAMLMLEFAIPLWSTLGYGYKADELKIRIRRRADDLCDKEEEFLRTERKNSRVRASTERAIQELKDIKMSMS